MKKIFFAFTLVLITNLVIAQKIYTKNNAVIIDGVGVYPVGKIFSTESGGVFTFSALTKNDPKFIEFSTKFSNIKDSSGIAIGTLNQVRIYLVSVLGGGSSPSGLTNAELRASPVPVSISSIPLPSGAATESTLSTLNTKTSSVNTNSVTITSTVLPSGASTSALQSTGNSSLSSIDGKDFATQTTLSSLNSKVTSVNTNSVTITSLPLPSGASTSANQTTTNSSLSSIDAGIPVALGQTTMSASMPVVLSSNQSTLPISAQDIMEEIQMTGLFRTKTAYCFNLIGQRNGFTSTSALDAVKEYDNAVSDFAVTSNSTLDIISSSANDAAAGTGVRTVKVTYIDNSNNLVESAAITLNGTTLVTSVLTGVNQVLWMETSTAGSGGVAAGNIRLRINGSTVECEQITTGGNKSRSAIFKVPTGYTGYVVNWRTSAVNNDQDVRLRGQINTLNRSLSSVFHYMSEKYTASNTNIPAHEIWLKVPALAIVKANTISGGTAATVRCNVNILIVIIQN